MYDFDIFFLIRGEIITEDFLISLKQKNPNAMFIMYQWDSIKNNSNYVHLLSYFDKVFTFDMVDAQKLNINYLPLFYTKKYEDLELSNDKKYDLVFFGSYNADRLEILKKINKECLKLDLVFKHHLFIQKLLLLKKIIFFQIKFKDLKYLSTEPVSTDEILENYKITKAVLDIENLRQNGFTMRTFEVLGANLKLITTNKRILKESIYNKMIIFLLNRESPFLKRSFFEVQGVSNIKVSENSISKFVLKIIN